MHRIISFILSVILLAATLVSSSCANGQQKDDTSSDETTATETVEEAKDVVIASDGENIYNFVRYIDAGDDEVKLILEFRNMLNEKYDLSVSITSDWTMPSLAPPADACEIIIGLTCREHSLQVIDELGLGYGDCAVQVRDDNKIVIIAPNYADLTIGFDYFMNNLSVVNNSENGEEQIVYTGGNYLYEIAEDHIMTGVSDAAQYLIVYNKDGSYKKYADDLAKAIKKNYGLTINAVPETEPRTEREIIIGQLSDPERFEYDHSQLNGLGYTFVTSEKSILIAGSTETSIKNAVDRFIEKFIRSGNIIAMNLPQNHTLSFNTFSGGEDPALAEGADTRIMSFNILSEEWDSAAVMEGRDVRVSAVILNYRPDVAALQEVSNAWYPVLEGYIGDVYEFTRKKTPSGSGTYTTLIYNKQTTKLVEEGIEIFTVGNSQRLRSVVWGVFESLSTKERYMVFSTHWDVGADKVSQRTSQANQMAKLAEALYAKHGVDIFACGDYNASDSSSEYKTFLNAAGFVDAKTSAKTINRACKTYHTLFQSVSTGTYDSIDHITFMEQTAPKVLYYNTLIHDYVLDASDHCPIYIDVKLSK